MNDMIPADLSIPPFLDRRGSKPLIYTYTMLSAYRNCPHAMYRRYVKRDQPYVETPEMKLGNDVHTAFEHRVGSRKPLPKQFHKWEHFAAVLDGRGANVELKLAMTKEGHPTGYWDNDCWFRGKIDVVIRQSDRAYIRDWKTGNSRNEDSFELETNALLLKAKFPELQTVRGDYVWLKEDRVGQSFDLSGFAATWQQINRLVKLIESTRANGDEFDKKKSGLCGWCSVTDCEHHYVARKQ